MSGWAQQKIRNLATGFLGGGTPSTRIEEYWVGDIPWITTKWLGDALYVDTGEKLINRAAVTATATNVVPAGNVLFATRVGVGKAAINAINIAINQDLAGILIDKTKLLPEFLVYSLRQARIQREVESHKRGATIKGITREVLKDLDIEVPSLEEQRQIARVLTTVQQAIEQQQAIIATTRELKRSLMHKLFTRGLRDEAQKQTETGLVPEGWLVKPLAQIGDVIYGIQAAVANKFSKDETPIFTNKNIDLEGRLDLTEVNSFKLETARHFGTRLQYGDVLFCWRSGSKEHVGKTAYFDLDGEYTHSSFLLRIRPPSQIIGRYLFLLLNHLRQDGYFVRMQNYAVNAKFNKSAIERLPVAMPLDEGEMREIVDALDTVMGKLELAQRKQDNLQGLFKTLLHQLMTAQLRVHDLDLDALGVPALD